MLHISSIIIGYLCGNYMTAERVAWKKVGKSARELGTGNPGMANIAAQLGPKYGAIVLLGDVGKTILAYGICYGLFREELGPLVALYAGLGTLLGHDFPFWKGFAGGKGVTVTCTLLILFFPLWGILACLVGLIAVYLTGYLPVGSILIPLAALPFALIFYGGEAGLVVLVIALLMIGKNARGLGRVARGEEPKVSWCRSR